MRGREEGSFFLFLQDISPPFFAASSFFATATTFIAPRDEKEEGEFLSRHFRFHAHLPSTPSKAAETHMQNNKIRNLNYAQVNVYFYTT